MLARILAAGLIAALTPGALVGASNRAGQLDPTFSGNGWVRIRGEVQYGPYFSKGVEDLVQQPDGQVVAVAQFWNDDNRWFGALRWRPEGDLDRSFGTDGWALVDVSTFEEPHAVTLQRDGKIVIAGTTDCALNCATVVRLNRDGSLDTTFAQRGVFRAPNKCDAAVDVAIQPDGRVVVAGFRYEPMRTCVFRLRSDGVLDRAFGKRGYRMISRTGGVYPTSMVLQRDGRIVVAGNGRHTTDTSRDFLVLRLRRDGSLDRGFSRDGFATVSFLDHDLANGLAIQGDGRIVLAGSAYKGGNRRYPPWLALARFTPSGGLDARFGHGGKLRLRPAGSAGSASAVATQQDGRIVVAGHSTTDSDVPTAWLVGRLTRAGRIDATFGDRGFAVNRFATADDWAHAVRIQRDGRIIVGGSIGDDHGLARYLPR